VITFISTILIPTKNFPEIFLTVRNRRNYFVINPKLQVTVIKKPETRNLSKFIKEKIRISKSILTRQLRIIAQIFQNSTFIYLFILWLYYKKSKCVINYFYISYKTFLELNYQDLYIDTIH